MRAESSNVCRVPDVRAGLELPGRASLVPLIQLRRVANQAHAWIPTVEEHHSFALKCVSNFAARRCRWAMSARLPVVNRRTSDSRFVGQFVKRPVQQASCRSHVYDGKGEFLCFFLHGLLNCVFYLAYKWSW